MHKENSPTKFANQIVVTSSFGDVEKHIRHGIADKGVWSLASKLVGRPDGGSFSKRGSSCTARLIANIKTALVLAALAFAGRRPWPRTGGLAHAPWE